MGPGEPRPLRVPIGEGSERWTSRQVSRRVLLVVHNVTSAGRLLDVLPLFHNDFRVQLLVTSTGSSAFQGGVRELFAELGLPVVPWEQAVEVGADLAISASFGGQLPLLQGKLSVLSHGVGYTKKLAVPGVEGREPTFGLSREWLLHDGEPYVDGLLLSHPEQLERLGRVCPEALHTGVVAGDASYDRMLAARPYRERQRRALGVRRGQRLVVLNSTWNPEGLFGSGGPDVLPALLPRLAAELPADDYRLAAVLHPNIWYGHGPGQIRAWLDEACRSGLALIDPVHGWRQALVAADALVGDFGSVPYYAAALGVPVLLADGGEDRLDPEAPLADFVRRTPRLDPHGSLRAQVEELVLKEDELTDAAEFVTSVPGESALLLRRHFYELMDLPEPVAPALLEPLPLPAYEPPRHTVMLRVRTRAEGVDVRIERSVVTPYGAEGDAHVAVHEDTRDPGGLDVADVIVRDGRPDDPRLGGWETWTAEVLARHTQCGMAVFVSGPDACAVRTRDGAAFLLSALDGADADPAAYASSLYAWLSSGQRVPPDGVVLRTHAAGQVHGVAVEPLTSRLRSGGGGR
ncbi:hypothetical protein KUM39_13520 [Streptomyces sp. J2-1]|uniref:hypothetical protein n=1 Tax=Streptomyces corallincola TaxID=2851888 RepID=UPI001C385523|nr:hypothetical protein [Streptomyces corallincola]MBV2355378.1 hypothetical protein [Streptomyces corallincola]